MKTVNRIKKNDKSTNISLYIGIALVGIFFLLLIFSFFYKKNPTDTDLANKFAYPSERYILGTDHFGRDNLARIMFSMRSVFSVGVGSVFVGAFLGTIIGILASISPKTIKTLIMNFIDGLIAFPGILIAMLIVFILGKGVRSTVIAIGIMMLPIYAKLSYTTIKENWDKSFIKAARSYGMNKFNVVIHHIFPLLLPKIIIQISSNISSAIMIESSLSFLGLGIQPPNASLGLMLKEAQKFALVYPHIILPPGISLILINLAFIFIGDSLNDKLVLRNEK